MIDKFLLLVNNFDLILKGPSGSPGIPGNPGAVGFPGREVSRKLLIYPFHSSQISRVQKVTEVNQVYQV